MNEGQAKFKEFALARVRQGSEAELEAIMAESFRKQEDGSFTPEYMAGVAPKMIALLRPECVEEFKQAAAHMRSQIDKGN
ncbi:MAG: hypothetical protein FWD94_07290 [Treponema sp.]|nr:hypothetical protein [Treponema sp.]